MSNPALNEVNSVHRPQNGVEEGRLSRPETFNEYTRHTSALEASAALPYAHEPQSLPPRHTSLRKTPSGHENASQIDDGNSIDQSHSRMVVVQSPRPSPSPSPPLVDSYLSPPGQPQLDDHSLSSERQDFEPFIVAGSLYEITHDREARATLPTGVLDYANFQQQLPWQPTSSQSLPWQQAPQGSFANATPQYTFLPPAPGQVLYGSPANATLQYTSGYPSLLPGQAASSPYSSVQATAAVFNAEVPQVFNAGAPHAIPPSLPVSALQHNWPELLEHCRKSDKVMLENWDGEIDTLLVFAGLFSAVVTAFAVEAYQLLQVDFEESSLMALATISRQLQAGASGGLGVPVFENPVHSASNMAITLNVLWFLSLLTALTSAFFAILLRQTFREYKSWANVPRTVEALRLRQLRFEAFTSWRVPEVVAALPALLELAVVLFVTGIPLFLWTMDITVAIITTIVVGFMLVVITIITILPVVNRTFPYKSPVAWGFWKLSTAVILFVRTQRKPSSSNILPMIVPSEETSTPLPHNSKQDHMSTTWQKRDLDLSKMEERQHLWTLLRWFCSEWSDHRLAPAVQRCMRDLVYGENAQSIQYHNYVDLIETGVPALLNLPSSKMWPLLISTCGLPSELLRVAYPQALTVNISEARALKQQVTSLPWKMLAMISDEMIVCLRVAITADFASDIYNSDKSRTLAFAGLCFLLCMFQPATAAGLEAPFSETWLALFCDICCHYQSTSLVHSGRHPEANMAWTLEDIVFPWFERLPLGAVSQNNALRMLHTLRIRFPQLLLDSGSTLGTYEMKMFTTLSSKALKVVIDNKYGGNATGSDANTDTPMSITPIDSAVMRVCRMIERIIHIAEKENIINCAMNDFPWLKELVPFTVYLTRACRVRIALGFRTGLFIASDKASQAVLMQALTVAGPLESKVPTDTITPKSILKTSLPHQTTKVSPDENRSNTHPSPLLVSPPIFAATTSLPYNFEHDPHPSRSEEESDKDRSPSSPARGCLSQAHSRTSLSQTSPALSNQILLEPPPVLEATPGGYGHMSSPHLPLLPFNVGMAQLPLGFIPTGMSQFPFQSQSQSQGPYIPLAPMSPVQALQGLQGLFSPEVTSPTVIAVSPMPSPASTLFINPHHPQHVGPPLTFSRHVYPHYSARFELASPHPIRFQGRIYPTAAHLLESLKFLREFSADGSRPVLEEIRERVRGCATVDEVREFIAGFPQGWVRWDWDQVVLHKVDEVLYLKVRQHAEIKGLLLGTGESELMYVEEEEPFWGAAENGGRNELGKALMRLRENLRQGSDVSVGRR